jgi:hypothetical protein
LVETTNGSPVSKELAKLVQEGAKKNRAAPSTDHFLTHDHSATADAMRGRRFCGFFHQWLCHNKHLTHLVPIPLYSVAISIVLIK